MTYLRRTNPTGKKALKTTIGIFLVLLVVFGIHLIFPSFYPSIFTPMASAAIQGGTGTAGFFGRAFALVSSKASLVKQNTDLLVEIKNRDTQSLLLSTLQKENEDLKTLLGRASSTKDIVAVVLSRPPTTPYDTLIIDIGEKKGVLLGDKVYVGGTILIGDVVEVYSASAKVSLFSTPGRQTPVLVGEKNIETQSAGRGSGNFIASLPSNVDVKVGDVITSPQIRAHVFGLVESVEVDSAHSIKTILFKAPFNMHELKFVEVETNR